MNGDSSLQFHALFKRKLYIEIRLICFATISRSRCVIFSATALSEPYSIVITDETATKYFGPGPALGKTLWTSLKAGDKPVFFSVPNILIVIGREFVLIVLLSAIVALLLAWYLVDSWLGDFAYRIPLGPGAFIIAALIAIMTATITVVFRKVRTANSNPVKWLRSE